MPSPHPVEPARKREFALEVVRDLRDAGFQSLWAGGCVRDLLLGLEPSDYDVATDARPEQVIALFRRTIPVGVSFGVVRVLGPKGSGEVEVATFRSDGAYVDGRRPTSVVFSSPELDAQRRDFTINGMFFDPLENHLLDFVGGRADLDACVLRAIGDPSARFEEDKLRLIRALRFAARFGLQIEPSTADSIRRMTPQIRVVAAERIGQELRRVLTHPTRALGARLLNDFGLLAQILPGLLPSTEDWEPTLSVLDSLPEPVSFPLALAALFSLAPGGADAVRHAAALLKLSNTERDHAAWLVHRWPRLECLAEGAPSARKQALDHPAAGDLPRFALALSRAGLLDASHALYVQTYLDQLPEGPLRPPPFIRGDDLRHRGLPPGPDYKRWLDLAYDAQLDADFHTRDAALAWLEARLPAAPEG